MTNVRTYTDKQLINKIKSLPTFKTMPLIMVVCVRSNEDEPNMFDDKLYLFVNDKCILATSCTTNSGTPALLGGWKEYNKKGVAVIASNKIYYNVYEKSDGQRISHHKDKMQALVQVGEIDYYRDNNDNDKTEQFGKIETSNSSTNIHFDDYNIFNKIVKTLVNGWSQGCIVLNVSEDYLKLLENIPYRVRVSLVVLDEFEPT